MKKKLWEQFGGYLLNSTAISLKLGWIGCAIQQETPKLLPRFFSFFSIHFFYNLIKSSQTTNAPTFLTHNISAIGGVHSDVALESMQLIGHSDSMGSCGHVETIQPTWFLGLIFHSGGSCYLNQTKGVIILSEWVDPTTTDTINQQCNGGFQSRNLVFLQETIFAQCAFSGNNRSLDFNFISFSCDKINGFILQ